MLVKTYRPRTFKELIGQDVLVKTITNAFKLQRIPHGFLLAGPRGTGKTTTARLIAKAFNCKNAPNTNFDPEDPICKSIDAGNFPDVQEMDAASHTGVNDMRNLIEGSIYQPLEGKTKVYILDEVHMLSKSAFNALLKTLEEPPDHVVFIFATTEIEKVPLTILSRCQRHYLHLVPLNTLVPYMKDILEKEKIPSEDEALRLIANVSEGSVRDALSLLDQALALADGHLTLKAVNEMVGGLSREILYDMFKLLYLGQREALEKAQKLLETTDSLMILDQILDITAWITKLHIHQEHFSKEAPTETDKNLGLSLLSIVSMGKLTRLWQALLKGRQDIIQSNNSTNALIMVFSRILYMSELPTPMQILSQVSKNAPLKEQAKEQISVTNPELQSIPKTPLKNNISEKKTDTLPKDEILEKIQQYVPNAKLLKSKN